MQDQGSFWASSANIKPGHCNAMQCNGTWYIHFPTSKINKVNLFKNKLDIKLLI